MDLFSDSLDRLKHELRVSKDGEVADALGMTKTAFSERKKRGSFPEKELKALAAKRPEIDVLYVLTGERDNRLQETQDEFGERMRGIKAASAFVDALPLPQRDRDGLKLTLTGDIERDAKLVGQFVARSRQDNDTANGTVVSAYSQGQVIPMPLNDQAGLTQHEVMTLVLDAMHMAKRTLPAIRVYAIVDAIMAWQRAGMTVTESTIVEQLRSVQ